MEEHFKNKLKNHKVDWNKEELLGNIQEELTSNGDDENKKWIWFLLLPILLFSTCWGWNYLQPVNTNTPVSKLESQKTPVESKSIESESQRVVSENSGFTQIKNPLEENAGNSKKTKNQENEDLSASVKSKLNSNLNSTQKSNTNSNTRASSSSSSSLRLNSNTSAGDAPTSAKKEINPEGQVTKPPFAIGADKVNTNNTTEDKSDIGKNNTVMNSHVAQDVAAPFNLIERLGTNELNVYRPKEKITFDSSFQEAVLDTDQQATGNHFYLSASTEMGLVNRNRNFTIDGEDHLMRFEANEATEKSLYIFTSNLFLGYQHDSRWSLQSGFEYHHIKEVFNHQEELRSEKFQTQASEPRYFIVSGMDTVFVYDTITVTRREVRTVRHYNDYKFYTVPFQIAYQFDLQKVRLTAKLGTSYTFASSFTGRRNNLSPWAENSEVIYFNDEYFQFELKNRVGFQAGLQVAYPLMNRHEFLVSATYRTSPSLTVGGAELELINQRFQTVSVGAGVKFRLGGNN